MIGSYYVLYVIDTLTRREHYWTGQYFRRPSGRMRCGTSDDRANARRFTSAQDAYKLAEEHVDGGRTDLLRFRVGKRLIKGMTLGMGDAA